MKAFTDTYNLIVGTKKLVEDGYILNEDGTVTKGEEA